MFKHLTMTQQKQPQPHVVTPEALAAVLERLVIAGNVSYILHHDKIIISVALGSPRGPNEPAFCVYHLYVCLVYR